MRRCIEALRPRRLDPREWIVFNWCEGYADRPWDYGGVTEELDQLGYRYTGADTWSHREIAAYVRNTFKVPDWWCQTVTVGYERIKGLRAIGQWRDGTYEASKSKVIPVPVSRLRCTPSARNA